MTRTEHESLVKLMEVGVACHLYAQEHDDELPESMTDVERYLREPLASDSSLKLNDYEIVASGKLGEIKRPRGEVILVRQKELFPGGKRAVVFVDTHGELVDEKRPIKS